jgi:hypothetical protein
MSWEVETTAEFDEWFATLSEKQEDQIVSAITALRVEGPNLGRPLVDTVKGSKHPNMKELRRRSFRILFAFDPERVAVLLVGGNKEGQWNRWYSKAIELADRLFDERLRRRGHRR